MGKSLGESLMKSRDICRPHRPRCHLYVICHCRLRVSRRPRAVNNIGD